jgi:hypothetical protein
VGATPANVTFTASNAESAQNGNGLHLQGGTAMLFSGNHFGGSTSQNLNGVQVDWSGFAYSNVQVRHNNVITTRRSGVPVLFNPTPGYPTGGIAFSDNAGFNPVGYPLSPQPVLTCSTPMTNPYPFPAEVYLTGTFGNILKNGITIFNSTSASQTLSLFLAVGESLTANCSGSISAVWFGA